MRTLIFLACLCFAQAAKARTFTNVDGRTIEAEIIAVTGDSVTIRLESTQKEFSIDLGTLSENDRAFVRAWSEAQEQQHIVSYKMPEWPRKVRAEDYEVIVLKEDNASRTYIYRTTNFEFHSNVKLARKVVRAFSSIFEATHAAVSRLPVQFKPEAPDSSFFKTRLFETIEDYYDAGGLPNSAGSYFRFSKEILCPLKSLGVKKSSSGYTLNDHKESRVLVHEITHQLTHRWLAQVPIWFSEGIAEYIAHVPYERDTFRFDRYDIEDLFEGSSEFLMLDLKTLMTMSHSAWNNSLADSFSAQRNYNSAFLLQYYFCHLDGEKNGSSVYHYLRALESGQAHEAIGRALMRGRDYKALQEALQSAYKREGLRIDFTKD